MSRQHLIFNVAEGEAMANFLSTLLKQGIRYVVERDGEWFYITLVGF